jgi:hypothetical protein
MSRNFASCVRLFAMNAPPIVQSLKMITARNAPLNVKNALMFVSQCDGCRLSGRLFLVLILPL